MKLLRTVCKIIEKNGMEIAAWYVKMIKKNGMKIPFQCTIGVQRM